MMFTNTRWLFNELPLQQAWRRALAKSDPAPSVPAHVKTPSWPMLLDPLAWASRWAHVRALEIDDTRLPFERWVALIASNLCADVTHVTIRSASRAWADFEPVLEGLPRLSALDLERLAPSSSPKRPVKGIRTLAAGPCWSMLGPAFFAAEAWPSCVRLSLRGAQAPSHLTDWSRSVVPRLKEFTLETSVVPVEPRIVRGLLSALAPDHLAHLELTGVTLTGFEAALLEPDWPALRALGLGATKRVSPTCLPQCPRLERLDLSGAPSLPPIPPTVRHLDVGGSPLDDAALANALAPAQRLETLRLDYTRAAEKTTAAVAAHCETLAELSLSTIPASAADLRGLFDRPWPRLRRLDLNRTQTDPTLASRLLTGQSTPAVTHLSLADTQLSSSLLELTSASNELRYLDLKGTWAGFATSQAQFNTLRGLNLSGLCLTPALIGAIGPGSQLDWLVVDGSDESEDNLLGFLLTQVGPTIGWLSANDTRDPDRVLEVLATVGAPALWALSLWGAEPDSAVLEALDAAQLPSLSQLALGYGEESDEVLATLAKHPLLNQLEVLQLDGVWCTPTAREAVMTSTQPGAHTRISINEHS